VSLIFTYDGVNSSLNLTAITFAWAIYYLKQTLKQAGWTVVKSGDGLSAYSSSSDIISTGNTGANGMDNNKAWFVVQMPSTTRQMCLQCMRTGANTSYLWRIKYSKGAGFSGGSPSATRVPSATDEVIVLDGSSGSSTDAAPTGGTFCGVTADSGFRFHCCADNASPYGFLSWGWQNTVGYPCHAFGLDPILGPCAADADPYILHMSGVLSNSIYGNAGSAWHDTSFNQYASAPYRQLHGWNYYFSGSLQTTWCGGYATPSLFGCLPASYQGNPNASYTGYWYFLQANADNKDDPLPIFIVASAGTYNNANQYRKGYLSLVRAVGQPARATGSRYTINSTYDGVVIGRCIVPWDGSSTVTL